MKLLGWRQVANVSGFCALGYMESGRITKAGEVVALPQLTAVVEKEGEWFVSRCPELGVASQGKTRKEAYAMLGEAVELWLEHASIKEIKRRPAAYNNAAGVAGGR